MTTSYLVSLLVVVAGEMDRLTIIVLMLVVFAIIYFWWRNQIFVRLAWHLISETMITWPTQRQRRGGGVVATLRYSDVRSGFALGRERHPCIFRLVMKRCACVILCRQILSLLKNGIKDWLVPFLICVFQPVGCIIHNIFHNVLYVLPCSRLFQRLWWWWLWLSSIILMNSGIVIYLRSIRDCCSWRQNGPNQTINKNDPILILNVFGQSSWAVLNLHFILFRGFLQPSVDVVFHVGCKLLIVLLQHKFVRKHTSSSSSQLAKSFHT